MKGKKKSEEDLTTKSTKTLQNPEKTEIPGNEGQTAESGTKRKSPRRLIANLLIIVGILIIAIPMAITYINTRRNDDIIDKFLADAQTAASNSQEIAGEEIVPLVPSNNPSETAQPSAETPAPSQSDGTLPVLNEPPSATPAPQPAAPAKKPTMSAEEIQKRMTGVLIIKKIDLRMVIMDGVDDETLRVAAGRMPETGNFDEIGNVVLAGHRSYTFGKYFNRLDELEPGDEIVVQTKTKALKYTVYQKFVVEPDDLSITNRNETDKILTLFTCTPVVIADHRLVIQAKQVE